MRYLGLSLFALALTAGCAGKSDKKAALDDDIFPDSGPSFDPADIDHDGYTPTTGDCNEDNPLVNPGAFEYEGNEVDDDCDGKTDNGYGDCDKDPLNVTDPANAAKAMNICPDKFMLNAEYKLKANAAQFAIRSNLGPKVPAVFGSSLFIMSTGNTLTPGDPAFLPTDPGTDFKLTYPRPAPYASKKECPSITSSAVHDAVDLSLKLKAPTNAKAFSFNVRFMTAEYPEFYCSQYNDGFAAILTSKNYKSKNIAYGSEGELLSVNVSFWSICENIPKYDKCTIPTTEIDGTGFGSDSGTAHGATKWLTTKAPIEPGEEFTLRLVVWDEGDGLLDSTVLLDNFRWDINPAEKESTVENPK